MNLFPSIFDASQGIRAYILPCFALGFYPMCYTARQTRSAMLDSLEPGIYQDSKSQRSEKQKDHLQTRIKKCADPGYYLSGTAGCIYFMRWFRSRECILHPGTWTLFRTVHSEP